jgi:quinol monooxygenase YgiN
MIIVAGTIQFDGSKQKVLDEAFDKMRAETLKEKGCHEYQCWVSRNEPGTAFFFEKWEDDAALAAHMTTPHMAEFGKAFGAIGVKGVDVKKYSGATEGPLH